MSSTEATAFLGGRLVGGGGADSLLVEGDRVVAMGSRSRILRSSPVGAARIELGGRCLLPGLIDAHVHLRESVLAASGIDLRGVRRSTEIEDRLLRYAELHPSGPLVGSGWDDTLLAPGERPDRELLDRAVPDRPVLLDRICGHVTVLNSLALEAAGVDRGTRSAAGGRIGRTRAGDPDGLLYDREVGRTNGLRRAALRSRPEATRRLLDAWSARGLTAVGAMYVDRAEYAHLADLGRRRPWPLAIRAYLRLDPGTPPSLPPPANELRAVGFKAILDGSLGVRTAWLERPYADAPGVHGYGLWSESALREALEPAARGGRAIALHAIGDRALGQALRVLESLGWPAPSRIEHGSVSPAALLPRIVRSGATVVIQPGFRTSDRWLVDRLGRRRSGWTHAYGRLAAVGVPLAGSSDSPVEPADPWAGMRAATVRRGSGPDPRRLTPAQALRAYTAGGSRALADPTLGHLGIGAAADLLLLAETGPWDGIRRGTGSVRGVWKSGRRVIPPATRSRAEVDN